MTKQAMIQKLAKANKDIEKVHIAVKNCMTIDNYGTILTRLVNARMEISIAISRLENPVEEI